MLSSIFDACIGWPCNGLTSIEIKAQNSIGLVWHLSYLPLEDQSRAVNCGLHTGSNAANYDAKIAAICIIELDQLIFVCGQI
jgi:hypothetical protein